MKIFNFEEKKINIVVTSVLLVLTLLVTIVSGKIFVDFSNYETKFYFEEGYCESDGSTRSIQKFSDYSKNIKDTAGDSNIYVIKGQNPGPSVLILGGTHPNEPSGQVAATLFLENVKVTKGTFYIVTETNKSAYTHSMPLEASQMYYEIPLNDGKSIRTFKYGARATNTNEQWPSPDIYVHSSGQKLSNTDTRNLNRSYPGSENGTYSEQVAYAITQLIIQNDITITFDLHEASPEYSTINAMICNSRAMINESSTLAMSLASQAQLLMESNYDITIAVEKSPENLHGLTHRELGTFTDSLVILCETSNASQGKIRGAFTSNLIVSGKDKFYERLVELDKQNNTKVIYAEPVDLKVRVARHIESILLVLQRYNNYVVKDTANFGIGLDGTDRTTLLKDLGKFEFSGMPDYDLICEKGIGEYLHIIEEEN